MPRYLRTFGRIIDPQAGAIEHARERQTALPDHLGQSGRISSIGTFPLRCHGAWCSVKGHQQARFRID